jgi:alkylation response protein AidB-like acyl-CoA dehydrogenase
MYSLHLTAEQLEFRDTVRDFVEREIKPAALHPDRLQPFEKPLLAALLDKASQMGLRTLALPEDAGGAGADTLTACIVLEELAAGDVDIAAALGQTALLGRELFGHDMTSKARARFLSEFVEHDDYHLALAGSGSSTVGWSYHRPFSGEAAADLTAVKQGGQWVINGTASFVANAPTAKLFAVQAKTDTKQAGARGVSSFLVPRATTGLTVRDTIRAVGGIAAGGAPGIRWHHGPAAAVVFQDCKVPLDHLLGLEGQSVLADGIPPTRGDPPLAAINLGVGRVAYDAAVQYAKLRRQGGRNIIEHQAIGTKLADCAIKLELARTMIWKAAWAADHPEAVADRSIPELPLHTIARVFTAEAVHEVTLYAAECFGAMGVMRDMPLQKYVHDGMVFLHSEQTDAASKLQVAEAIAGYQRPLAA